MSEGSLGAMSSSLDVLDSAGAAPCSDCCLLKPEALLMPSLFAIVSRVHRWIRFEGTGEGGASGNVELDADGRRNGRAPFGEAWLLDEIVTKEKFLNFRYACHNVLVCPRAKLSSLRCLPATSDSQG